MFCSNCEKQAVCLVKIGGMLLPFCKACAEEDENDRDTWPISILDAPKITRKVRRGRPRKDAPK